VTGIVDESALMDDPVSPELVLVDPELRERLLRESFRELLDAGGETLRRPVAFVSLPPPAPLLDTADAPPPPPRVSRRTISRRPAPGTLVAAASLAALLLALPSLAFLPPRQAPQLGSEPPSQRAAQIVTWQPIPAADYYLFEMSANGRLVKLEPVRKPSVTLGESLPAGRYAWRVFTGHGAIEDHDTRGPIAGGTVTLP
jgi:hypothetical protein